VLALVKRAADKVRLTRENRALLEDLKKKNEELRRLNEMIRELAIRDGLTGLYNYRYFSEALRNELARAQRYRRPLCLLMIDVDHFKLYNDQHGHLTGDEVLRDISRLLQERARRTDLIARYGGEEFVVVLPETCRAAAQRVAEEFRRRIVQYNFPNGDQQPLGRVTVSIGVAESPSDATEARDLIERADQALYAAKSAGRNCVVGAETLPAPAPRGKP
jgi:diguanylate cyclase (GGDEF)-like protein